MKPRLFAYSFLSSWAFLTAIASTGLGAILIAGSAFHGEPIGGPWLLVPVFAAVGSLLSLLCIAVPAGFALRWLFEKNGWRRGFRWVLIPFTGPVFFCILTPIFLLLGERDVFLSVIWSLAFGTVVSTYWLAYLIFDYLLTTKQPNQTAGVNVQKRATQP